MGAEEMSAVIRVIEDDNSLRDAICELLLSVGFTARAFVSAADFLERDDPDIPGCLVLDVRLPGLGGLELQRRRAELGVSLPIIFITAHGDIPMSVGAMKEGAVDFLPKPFRDQALLDAVRAGVAEDSRRRVEQSAVRRANTLAAGLTAREREVMLRVADGRRNKEIARELALSEVTVKMHRASLLRKMEVTTPVELAELVRRLTE